MKHYLDKEVESRKGFSWKDGVETSLYGERNDGAERSIYAGEKGVITELVSLRRNEVNTQMWWLGLEVGTCLILWEAWKSIWVQNVGRR